MRYMFIVLFGAFIVFGVVKPLADQVSQSITDSATMLDDARDGQFSGY